MSPEKFEALVWHIAGDRLTAPEIAIITRCAAECYLTGRAEGTASERARADLYLRPVPLPGLAAPDLITQVVAILARAMLGAEPVMRMELPAEAAA